MKLNKQEIFKKLEANRQVLKGFGVMQLGLVGSFACDEETESSDLDFIVEFKHKTFDDYMDLKFYLEELFKLKVDLILPETIKPRLRTAFQKDIVYAEGL